MLAQTRLMSIRILLALIVAGVVPATRAATPPLQAQPAGPVRIGASVSFTGVYDQAGQELRNGYLLWMEEVNAAGGILGRPIEFVIYDDASDPETATHLYERLITEDKVDLVLAPYSSRLTIPVSTVTERYGFPLIAAGASASEVWTRGNRYVFGIYTLAPSTLDGAIAIAIENGYGTAAVINETTIFPRDTVAGAQATAIEAGMQIVARREYSPDVRDLTPTLVEIRALDPDVLIGGTYDEHAMLIVRQLKDLDWVPKMLVLTIGPSLPEFYEVLGADANYVFGASDWEPAITAPGVPQFVASYTERYGYVPGDHGAVGFAAGQLLQQAIERTQSFDNERIRDALAALETSTIFGPYKVDATGAQIAKPSYLVQWLNGERKIVWPDDVAEAAYIVPMPAWDRR